MKWVLGLAYKKVCWLQKRENSSVMIKWYSERHRCNVIVMYFRLHYRQPSREMDLIWAWRDIWQLEGAGVLPYVNSSQLMFTITVVANWRLVASLHIKRRWGGSLWLWCTGMRLLSKQLFNWENHFPAAVDLQAVCMCVCVHLQYSVRGS